ncbi:MAG TPA: hypothetical protein ENI96_01615 [Sedimenticola thiotaurini]|uniref:M23ase beta-sheet core domain-containing protein n=1 Tax=Sedimenticola thiotaurini TaxID=1543721 RepID=A0A831RH23_9GAMM|nr:hypothetical protein [Sedimenticola thiotaurini]
MKAIPFTRICGGRGSGRSSVARGACLLGGVLLLTGSALWGGYELGLRSPHPPGEGEELAQGMQRMLKQQQQELEAARRQMRAHLDALALRLGQMQSEVLRLDALGQELVKKGDLDPEEFNFDEVPARGGLGATDEARSVELEELLVDMNRLSRRIEDRAHKLEMMEGLIVNGRVLDDLEPRGRPVRKGWISSPYGYRKDPFTGKKAFHHGVDIAGKKDSEVFAVASGIVTDAGPKKGYGYLVEITHADGLVTRYGHNDKIFVSKGDLVTKGEVIGLMGSTGRSTGPHVHFEVTRNGRSLNPAKYLRKG